MLTEAIYIYLIVLTIAFFEKQFFRFKELEVRKEDLNNSVKKINNIDIEFLLLIIILLPIIEELIFRYLFLGIFNFNVIICGIIFGVIHLSKRTLISKSVFGIMIGYFYLKHGLISTILVHSFFNFIIMFAAHVYIAYSFLDEIDLRWKI